MWSTMQTKFSFWISEEQQNSFHVATKHTATDKQFRFHKQSEQVEICADLPFLFLLKRKLSNQSFDIWGQKLSTLIFLWILELYSVVEVSVCCIDSPEYRRRKEKNQKRSKLVILTAFIRYSWWFRDIAVKSSRHSCMLKLSIAIFLCAKSEGFVSFRY